jgi:hypothetical protein
LSKSKEIVDQAVGQLFLAFIAELLRCEISGFHGDDCENPVFWDFTSCGFWKNDISEESIASIIRMERISELGTSAVTEATQRKILEDGILPSTCVSKYDC